MNILVTGGNGFIGSYLLENLRRKGHRLSSFDRTPKPTLDPRIRQIKGDILNLKHLKQVVNRHDAAINLVGKLGTSETIGTPFESLDVNLRGALNFYEAIRSSKKPAVAITMGAYTWPNTYSITKYAAERFALMYNLYHATKIAVVRAMNVYGPGQKHAPVRKVVPNFIRWALANRQLRIYGDGKQRIDLITVEDCAEILSRALLRKHKSFDIVFEAGSGKPITVNRLADLVIKLTGSRSKMSHVPMRPGEPPHSLTQADPAALKRLGITAKVLTPLSVGLKKTIAWYKHHDVP
jgi:nucleoside-diphosphate-sugar epimerase